MTSFLRTSTIAFGLWFSLLASGLGQSANDSVRVNVTVNADGSSTTRPLTDLHDLAEGVVARFEQDKTP